MTSKRYLALLVTLLLALLSVGLGIDQTFSEINQGLTQNSATENSEGLYVWWSESGPKLTSRVDDGRYFLNATEIEQVNRDLPISLTLLEHKDARTVTLFRIEKWDEKGLLSAVYEGHQTVAVPVRSSFLPNSQVKAAVWSGVRYALLTFFGAGGLLGLLFYLRGSKRREVTGTDRS